MKKSEFIQLLISEIESICIDNLDTCYDVTTDVHNLVNNIDTDWEPEDEDND